MVLDAPGLRDGGEPTRPEHAMHAIARTLAAAALLTVSGCKIIILDFFVPPTAAVGEQFAVHVSVSLTAGSNATGRVGFVLQLPTGFLVRGVSFSAARIAELTPAFPGLRAVLLEVHVLLAAAHRTLGQTALGIDDLARAIACTDDADRKAGFALERSRWTAESDAPRAVELLEAAIGEMASDTRRYQALDVLAGLVPTLAGDPACQRAVDAARRLLGQLADAHYFAEADRRSMLEQSPQYAALRARPEFQQQLQRILGGH